MLADEDQMFYCKLMLEKLRNCNIPNLNELFKFAGIKIWPLYSNRQKNRSPLLSQIFHSYAQMLSLNEKSQHWLPTPARPLGSFIQIAESKKWSGLYRIMSRKNIDNDIPRPPAYFTRRRDGIPVPSLHRFMDGYKNLSKLKLSSKSLETGFNILICVCWTNQKDDWAQQAGGGGGPGLWHLWQCGINCTPPV